MIGDIQLHLIVVAAVIASASPGPATLAIAGTSMTSGRAFGLATAAGITTGSLMWSISAALGLSAVMYANVWLFETLRYVGAGYLLFLAFKSAKSALTPSQKQAKGLLVKTYRAAYLKGMALHLTNPKAIFFFGSLYTIGIPAGSPPEAIAIVVATIATTSFLIFHTYALLFSSAPFVAGYARLRRWFEAAFSLAFGFAGLKILTARL